MWETVMKKPGDVGRDFDQYAKDWADQQYKLEVQYSADELVRDESAAVQCPGDEWGDAEILRTQYRGLVDRLKLPKSVDVLEIGAGGGRSTVALLDALGDRAAAYHVIDVADAFVDTLRGRVNRELDIHIVSDVDVSMIESSSIDLVLAQSSWSHINLYDQYRYLRDLRRVLRPNAPLVVSGLFLLGVADDWTWNRFRRRVHQIDQGIEGVYHEFTSIGALTEMLARLGYQDVMVFAHGFVARRGALVGQSRHHATLSGRIDYRYRTHIDGWLADGRTLAAALPPGPPGPAPHGGRAASARAGVRRVRRSMARRVRAARQRWR
jgi:SAM-dependent methyltransferase